MDGVVFYVHANTVGYMGDGFYRSKDPTNNWNKVLKGYIQYINNRKIH